MQRLARDERMHGRGVLNLPIHSLPIPLLSDRRRLKSRIPLKFVKVADLRRIDLSKKKPYPPLFEREDVKTVSSQ
jgi:hypothetical protein